MQLPPLKTIQVLVLTTVTTITTYSIAQDRGSGHRGGGFGSMMSSGGMTPDYMLRDLQQFQIALELEDDQNDDC